MNAPAKPVTRHGSFDPFFDDPFKRMFLHPMRFHRDALPELQIRLDVSEGEAAYDVSAELPGVKKEDIHVSVDGNRVRISAAVKRGSEEKKGDQLLRSERYYSSLERSFTLASDIDEGKVDAKYAGGVLKLRLSKKAASSMRQVTVN